MSGAQDTGSWSRSWSPIRLSLCLALVCLAGSTGAAADENAAVESERALRSPDAARARLSAMFDAIRELHYEGEFVHIRGSHVSALRIVHRGDVKNAGTTENSVVSDQGSATTEDATQSIERERISSIAGKPREIFRDAEALVSVWPMSGRITIDRAARRQLLPMNQSALTDTTGYRVDFAGHDRVAARSADVFDLMPQDDYRYGYRYWLDRENDMLLRVMVLDGNVQPLEQMMFTRIEFPASVKDAAVMLDRPVRELLASHGLSGDMRSFNTTSRAVVGRKSMTDLPVKVSVDWLPDGFEKHAGEQLDKPAREHPVAHFVFSDGVADVSVYIEQADDPTALDGRKTGLSTMGALSAWREKRGMAMITVVGSVPPKTAEGIAEGIRLE